VSSKKRNLLSLSIVLVLCAVLARTAFTHHPKGQDPAELGDPNQLVVETRYSLPWHDQLTLRRGSKRLFELPRLGGWRGGGKKDQVYSALGDPSFRFEFLDEEYFVWEGDVRYDWDIDNKFAGRYVSINFNWEDTVSSVTISPTPPLDATPIPTGSSRND
jgi:hypothetical protein